MKETQCIFLYSNTCTRINKFPSNFFSFDRSIKTKIINIRYLLLFLYIIGCITALKSACKIQSDTQYRTSYVNVIFEMYVNQFRYNITGSELESIITYSNLEFIDAIKTNILLYFKVVRVFLTGFSIDPTEKSGY